jgi:hypothetical protein
MTEAELHRSVVKWLRMLYWRVPVIWFSVPNSPRSRTAGHRLKAEGMLAGAPDLVFLWNVRGQGIDANAAANVLLIELKRPKSRDTTAGRLSQPQRIFQAGCEHAGVPYMIARSISDCEAALKERGLIK